MRPFTHGKSKFPTASPTLSASISPPNFFGRDQDLADLTTHLANSPKVVLVNGTGGIGKTTLARAYFQTQAANYDHVVWVERSEDLIQSFALNTELITNLGLTFTQEDTLEMRFQRVLLALRNLAGNNLLILDNAESQVAQPDIRQQLPQPPHWKVLVTSRQDVPFFTKMQLGKLERPFAIQLFEQHYPNGNYTPAELTAFLDEVDDHTLSIELFAKTLANSYGTLTLAGILPKIQQRELADKALQRKITSEHSRAETTVYQHLLTAFSLANLTAAEQHLLTQFTVLPPEPYAVTGSKMPPVPNILEWIEEPPAGEDWLDLLHSLHKKGWLDQERLEDGRVVFFIHRMVQQAIFYQLKPKIAEIQSLFNFICNQLGYDVYKNPVQQFPFIPYGQYLLTVSTFADEQEISRLQNQLALVLQDLGDYAGARDLLEKAMQSAEKNFGDEHPTTAVSYANYGYLLNTMDEKKTAIQYLQKAYLIFKEKLGNEHPHTQQLKRDSGS